MDLNDEKINIQNILHGNITNYLIYKYNKCHGQGSRRLLCYVKGVCNYGEIYIISYQTAKKWPEMVVQLPFMIQFHFESEYTLRCQIKEWGQINE